MSRFSDDILLLFREQVASQACHYVPRLASDGSDILGAVDIEVATLTKHDPTLLTDRPKFLAVVRERARWQCLKHLRDTPWGDPWMSANNLEGN